MAKANHLPLIDIKPCKLLHRAHVPYPVITWTKRRPSGVYKVAFKWETVYVGASSNIIKDLRKEFSGNGNRDLTEFLLNLPKEELEMVSVYWLDETRYVHNCGKSYMECISDLQGKKPVFNDVQSIPCSTSTARVSLVNTDFQTFKQKGQSQDVSVSPSIATEERKKVIRWRLSSVDKPIAPGISLMSRKRPMGEDRERLQFHTARKKTKTGEHVEQSMHRPLTTNLMEIPICRSETANISTTVLSADMNMETPEVSQSNTPKRSVMPRSSYKQRSQSVGGAPVDMSLNHEHLTTRELPPQFCISPRSPEFEERMQHDTIGCLARRSDIRKDNRGNIPVSATTKDNQPACPTTSHFDKGSQKGPQLETAGEKCKSAKEETFTDCPTASQRQSRGKHPRFQSSSGRYEQTHTVSSTQYQHTAITPRHELKPSEKDPGQNEQSSQENKESTPRASSVNDPERNIKMPPVSSTSVSGNSLVETVSVSTPHIVSEPDATASCTGIRGGDNSKQLERILRAASVKPSSFGCIKECSERRETMYEITSSPCKGPDANTVRMLVCESTVSSTQTCHSNQNRHTKVPNKAFGEPRSQKKVANKTTGQPRSQTKVSDKSSGEPRSQKKVRNKASGEPRSQTKVSNKVSGEPRSQKKVPNKASGEPRSQKKVSNKSSGMPRSQTKVSNKASEAPCSLTIVPIKSKESGGLRLQPIVSSSQTCLSNQTSQTEVPNKASKEPRSQATVKKKACGQPRSQTKVPNVVCCDPHSQTNVPSKASGEPRTVRTQPLPKKDSGTTQEAGVFSVIKTIGSKVFTMMNPFASNNGQ